MANAYRHYRNTDSAPGSQPPGRRGVTVGERQTPACLDGIDLMAPPSGHDRRYCAAGNSSGLEPARSGLHGIAGSCWVVTSRPAEITEQYATTCGSPKFTLQRITGCPR